jgi:hypothetical protein
VANPAPHLEVSGASEPSDVFKATTAGIAGDEHDEIAGAFQLDRDRPYLPCLAFCESQSSRCHRIVYESGLLFVSGCRSVAG